MGPRLRTSLTILRRILKYVWVFGIMAVVLWQRSQLTLGDVTLTAIVDRVLHLAGEQFPALGSVALSEAGLSWREPPAGADPARLAEGIRFVLVEFLTVLGNLTAEILTPALHAELSGQPASSSSHPTDEDPT